MTDWQNASPDEIQRAIAERLPINRQNMDSFNHPNWIKDTDAALSLPLEEGDVWVINYEAGLANVSIVHYEVNDTTPMVYDGIAMAACMAWLAYKDNK